MGKLEKLQKIADTYCTSQLLPYVVWATLASISAIVLGILWYIEMKKKKLPRP